MQTPGACHAWLSPASRYSDIGGTGEKPMTHTRLQGSPGSLSSTPGLHVELVRRGAKEISEMFQRTEQRPSVQVSCQGSPAALPRLPCHSCLTLLAQIKGLRRASCGQPPQDEKTPSSHFIPLFNTSFLHSLLFRYWSLLLSVLEHGWPLVNKETKPELKPCRSCLLCIMSCSCFR